MKKQEKNESENNDVGSKVEVDINPKAGEENAAETITDDVQAVKQTIENLPDELLTQPRWFKIFGKSKPQIKDWSNPANQRPYTEIETGNGYFAAFDISGHGVGDDYLVVDFDHVLDDDGNFVNDDAQKWYNCLKSSVDTYCELSCSKHGLHFAFKPRKGEFYPMSSGREHSLIFDDTGKIKAEIFYMTGGRYIFFTGDVYNCAPKTPIATDCDAIYLLLDEIRKRNPETPRKTKSDRYTGIDLDNLQKALDTIQFDGQFTYQDWIYTGMALHADLGDNDDAFTIWRNFSARDTRLDGHGKPQFNESKLRYFWAHFNSNRADENKIHVGTIFNIAKRYGYQPPQLREKSKNIPPEENVGVSSTRKKIPSCPVDLLIPGGYGIDEFCIAEQGKPFTSTPIVPTKLFKTHGSGEYLIELAYYTYATKKWHGGIVVGLDVIADKHKILQLAKFFVDVNSKTAKTLSEYLTSIIHFWRNDQALTTLPTFRNTGWYNFNGNQNFIIDGKSRDYLLQRPNWNLADVFTPRGNLDLIQQKFDDVATNGGPITRLVLGAALLAPMLQPLELPNVQIHLFGKRGSGKSAFAKFCVSLFGDPSPTGLQKTFQASTNNLYEQAAAFNGLPTLIDELETIPKKRRETDLSNLFYDYSLGVGRQIQRRDGTQRPVEKYTGTRITTGESAALTVSDRAGAYKRLLQLPFEDIFNNDFSIGLHEFCADNFGLLGRQWIDRWTAFFNDDSGNAQQLKNLYLKIRDHIRSGKTQTYEPTHLQIIAACLFAFYLYRNNLDWTASLPIKEIDFDADFVIGLLPTKAEIDDTHRAIAALKSYVAANLSHFYLQTASKTNEKFSPNPFFGFIYDDDGVAILPTVLRTALEKDLGFTSTDKLLADWRAEGLIQCDTDHYTIRKSDLRFGGPNGCTRRLRLVYFNPGVLIDDEVYHANYDDDD